MINVVLFFVFFLLVCFVFNFFCEQNCRIYKTNFLPITPSAVIFIFIVVLLPTLLITFRSEQTGIDTIRYFKIFTRDSADLIILYHLKSSFEYLYWGLTYLFYLLDNIRGLFFTFAIISLFVPFLAIYRLASKCNPFIASLLFLLCFYQECFNGMRQMVAMAFIFLAFTFVLSRNFIAFLISVVVASLFHSTAVVLVVLYFLYPSRILNSFDYAKRILVIFAFVGGINLFLNMFFLLDFAHQYEEYSESLYNVTISQSLANFFVSYMPLCILVCLVYIGKPKSSTEEKKDFDFLWFVFFLCGATIILRFVQNWFFRLGWYFQIGEILLIAKLCKRDFFPNDKGVLANCSISSTEILPVYVALYYFCWNYIYFDQSPLVNFSLG